MSRTLLPPTWSEEHDIFICHHDSQGHSIPYILSQIRKVFPGLNGDVIRAEVLDRRLRMLDQKGTDYFSRNVDGFWWGRRMATVTVTGLWLEREGDGDGERKKKSEGVGVGGGVEKGEREGTVEKGELGG
ncbi:MAG: hypothetical protein M1816_006569 [Peltula sp. TS41687]|nr:MAG: hypothetical protein M1816_006569 [Peltula sp. TS41687]